MKVPKGMYAPEHDGLGDPDRATVDEVQRMGPERQAEVRARRESLSPEVRKLQAASDRATGSR